MFSVIIHQHFNNNFFEIFIFLIIVFSLGLLLVILPTFLSTRKDAVAKLSTYECGFEPFGEAQDRFDIHFIIIAILFLLFDFELLLLVPFILSYNVGVLFYGPFFLLNLFIFLFLLLIAFIYEWFSGALVWPIFLNKK